MRVSPVRLPLPAFAGATVLAVAAPSAVAAPADPKPAAALTATATAPGTPGQVAWTDGRLVRVRDASGARRTVARLRRPIDARDGLTLSRDGRRLAVVAEDGLWTVPVADGGPAVRIGDRLGYYELVRWSADDRRLLYVGERSLNLCDAAGPCRELRDDSADEFGATWAPDGGAVAYVRRRGSSGGEDDSEPGDLVAVDLASDRTTVVERATGTGDRFAGPLPPTWTRGGLAWSSARYAGEDADAPQRVRVRLRGADGRTRTLTSSTVTPKSPDILLVGGEAPDGAVAGLLFSDGESTDSTAVSHAAVLGADGVPRPIGPAIRQTRRTRMTLLGRLADGRIAVQSESTRNGRLWRTALYVVAPDATRLGAPAVVGQGPAGRVSAAMAFPNDASAF
ncbi:hypothetical protein AB0L40_15970 [Patulibacter sp. NPDC049589]|uniref:hypothetical protein n=1 Tax=Patulibacter sp. NPDC049589 TaxID=3154731 RepID=UPI00341C05B8